MALQHRVNPAKGGHQFFFWKISRICKGRIEGGGSVAFREDETIPLFKRRILRVIVHLVKIQRGQHLYHGKGAAEMTGLYIVDHL